MGITEARVQLLPRGHSQQAVHRRGLKEPGDLELAHKLFARADVFIQNFRSDGLTHFGLDYNAVQTRNDAVIYCSISGFGTTGGAKLRGYDLLGAGDVRVDQPHPRPRTVRRLARTSPSST